MPTRQADPVARRALLVIRAAWGAALILAPARVAGAPDGAQRRWCVIGARALGARELVQAGLLARHTSPRAARWSMLVDALHAATMLALAALVRGVRPAALRSAAAAGAQTAATAILFA